MDPQWSSYADSSSASRRHNGTAQHQQVPRDYAPQHPQQPGPPAQAGYKYDPYHGGASIDNPAASAPAAAAPNSAASHMANPHMRDGNGDVPMHDAHGAHAGIKYPMRPHHQSHPSGGRSSNLHSPQDSSAAAQRYSPLETLSPSSPYGAAPQHRQSPTKQGDYSQSPYYAARSQGQQLPPINPYASAQDGYPSSAVSTPMDAPFSADPKSPRRQQAPMPTPRGPVPEFRKIRGVSELRPKNNHQPPFRRANPEGGFISVSNVSHANGSFRPPDLSFLAFTSPYKPSSRYLPYLQPRVSV